jgi:predicted nucleic acid-binding protein
MDNNPKRICWETSCFSARFNEEAGRVEVCKAILEAAKKGDVELYTSFITVCEWAKIKGEYASEAEDTIAEFLRNPYIRLVAIDWSISRITRDLVRRHNLDVRDAIHLATAIRLKVDVLHTYDKDHLIPLNGKIPEVNVVICEPVFIYQTSMRQIPQPSESEGVAQPNGTNIAKW